jgi:hypothetical protein
VRWQLDWHTDSLELTAAVTILGNGLLLAADYRQPVAIGALLIILGLYSLVAVIRSYVSHRSIAALCMAASFAVLSISALVSGASSVSLTFAILGLASGWASVRAAMEISRWSR